MNWSTSLLYLHVIMEEFPHRGDAASRLLQTGQPFSCHGDVDGVDEDEGPRPSERLHDEAGQPVDVHTCSAIS